MYVRHPTFIPQPTPSRAPSQAYIYSTRDHYLTLTPGNPSQHHNLHYSHPTTHLTTRFDNPPPGLESCLSPSCTQPWRVGRPNGDVSHLSDALRQEHDSFHEPEARKGVSSRCERGFWLDASGEGVTPVFRGKGARRSKFVRSGESF